MAGGLHPPFQACPLHVARALPPGLWMRGVLMLWEKRGGQRPAAAGCGSANHTIPPCPGECCARFAPSPIRMPLFERHAAPVWQRPCCLPQESWQTAPGASTDAASRSETVVLQRAGPRFEGVVRAREAANPKFAFLHPWSPSHAAYRCAARGRVGLLGFICMECIRRGCAYVLGASQLFSLRLWRSPLPRVMMGATG